MVVKVLVHCRLLPLVFLLISLPNNGGVASRITIRSHFLFVDLDLQQDLETLFVSSLPSSGFY